MQKPFVPRRILSMTWSVALFVLAPGTAAAPVQAWITTGDLTAPTMVMGLEATVSTRTLTSGCSES